MQLEKLNNIKFSDNEWKRFFDGVIANKQAGIVEKTTIIQENHIQLMTMDDGSKKNIYLIDKKDIHNNYLQVINQYEVEDGLIQNRYDVTILVNGLPLVHIELKRRGVDIREAFNQIKRYNRESFWAGSGLFEYIQLFVISNGTYTKYYSNTTRYTHVKENEGGVVRTGKRTSNSFEFTSWWSDGTNKRITDLVDFTKTFFAKHTILNIIITKYCVLTCDKILLVMRPYQITATERILNKIEISHNYKKYGTTEGGGFIWHTTGSGKTLTSFKTAQLATKFDFIDKVLFVVDRKDLDYQTMKEYDKFSKGCANGNTNTNELKKQLEDPSCRIIVTTIQKLSIFIKKNKDHFIKDKEIVIIFDECHRSQFGEMHIAITKFFKQYYLFGFTGTPIFAINASLNGRVDLKTTEQAFGRRLHEYTIVNAINDGNVLPFHVEYISTFKSAENIEDKKVIDIDRQKVLIDPKRISKITEYILEHFDQKTLRNECYKLKDRRLNGFNSIFAVSSIEFAKLYYAEFKKQMEKLPSDKKIKVALIYSFGVNEEETDGIIDDENTENTDNLDSCSRDFLENAIKDYNKMFSTNYDTSSDGFQNYYKDVSQKVKDRELDLLIVVNMFLTGFDATTLNTLWVDKNLRLHGLLQAFSRTNRILNSVKTFGNIVSFRNLEKATNESLSLFSDKNINSIVLLRTFEEYYSGYEYEGEQIDGYKQLIDKLLNQFPIGKELETDKDKKEFISLFNAILKVKNILSTFDDFSGKKILEERDFQDYQSIYINLYDYFNNNDNHTKENINDDIVFEIELLKRVDINIDYILILIERYHNQHLKDKDIIAKIQRIIDSSFEFRNKKDLIENFISSLKADDNVDQEWEKFIESNKIKELNDIIEEEHLNKEETYRFIKNSFKDGYLKSTGIYASKVLPPISHFGKNSKREEIKENIFDKLKKFFDRFKGICKRE